MDISLVALLCFIAIVSVCGATFMLIRDLFAGNTSGGSSVRMIPGSRGFRRSSTVFDELPATSLTGKLDQAFDRVVLESGLEATPIAAFLLVVAVGLLSGGCMFLYFDNVLLGIVGMTFGMFLTLVWFLWSRNRRHHQIRDELPHVLDLLSRAVRAGESLDQAIDLVGKEVSGILGIEFQRCAQQLEMGLSVGNVMHALSRRISLLEIRMLTTTLVVHRQTGGNLPVALERMAAVIRDRLNYKRQMRATTGAGRTSTLLIATVSPIVYLIMFIWQPEHVNVLLDSSLGQFLLILAVVLEIVGVLWVVRMLRFDY